MFDIEFEILEANAELVWRFKTDARDIGFGIQLQGHGDIIPVQRVDSHKSVQEGQHICEIPGIYKIIFDNTYSYTRGKTLRYKIDVTS